MAGTLKILDTKLTIDESLAMGLAAAVTGVFHDGFHYWATDNIYLYQLYLTQQRTLEIVNTPVDLSGIADGFTSLGGVVGNGDDLYVIYRSIVSDGGFPPLFAEYTGVVQINKKGIFQREIIKIGSLLLAGGIYQDIAFNRNHLYTIHFVTSPSVVSTIRQISLQSLASTKSYIVRVRSGGLTFDKGNLLFVGGAAGANLVRLVDRTSEANTIISASLGVSATGATMLGRHRRKHHRMAVCHN